MSALEIRRVYLPDAQEARGVVIVIDVIRAFTVAAYALAGGASRLWLVRTTDEAFALRQRAPQALLAGEIGGRLIPGFDYNNSPSLMAAGNIKGTNYHSAHRRGYTGSCKRNQCRPPAHLLSRQCTRNSALCASISRGNRWSSDAPPNRAA